MKKRNQAVDRFIHALVIGYHHLAVRTPLRTWVAMGKILGRLAYVLDREHREIALANLRFAFGDERDRGELETISRRNFEQWGMIAHEWMRLRRLDAAEVASLIRVEGREHLIAAKRKSPSVILLGAHFGNWEYAHLYYASQVNALNFIVRAIDNPYIEQERVSYNERACVRVLYKENGLRPAIRNLRKGEDLIIFADRKADEKDGLPCLFFGRETLSLTVVPALARKYRLPVVPMFIVREKDPVRHRIVFMPELPMEDGPGNRSLRRNVDLQNRAVESAVRSHPDHWVWFHKRWKRHYPELYPRDMARRRRRRIKKQSARMYAP
jgi:KDO2-lipid IV(A) lauroyltransferase